MKELASGIIVDSQQYYQLLDWKEENMRKFMFFCKEYNIGMSINNMNESTYKALLQYSNLD